MKVFMVHEDPWNAGNPYIYTLIESLESHYPEIRMGWGRDSFWGEDIFSYDIVHFHWPQAFMAGEKRRTIGDLKSRILELKSRGVKIVSTCHDLQPHYTQCAEYGSALTIVYELCDAVFHMGNFSKELFETKYPKANHYIIPHHIYDTVYSSSLPDRERCCNALGIKKENAYVLCFGSFRSDDERSLIRFIARHSSRKVHFIAPSFLEIPHKGDDMISYCLAKCSQVFHRLFYRIHMTGRSWVPVSDENLPYYYGACDFAFVQRLKILNSGNAVLPLLFGKVVVGPDAGNVGPLLRQIDMPIFNVNEKRSILRAFQMGLQKSKEGIGGKTQEFINANFSTETISRQLYQHYCQLVENM